VPRSASVDPRAPDIVAPEMEIASSAYRGERCVTVSVAGGGADQIMSETSIRSQARTQPIVKVAMTALAGSSIEWYDFFIYGTAAALVFPTVFFARDLSPLVAQLASFSTFAVGFLARPLGGVVFGHFGDRAGRKVALVTALLMMGAATTLIGLLPSYADIGSTAPVMLVVLRFVQGLAIGGQWAGAVLLATENAPRDRRGFYGAFAQAGVPAGVILANLTFLIVNAVLSPRDFLAWGWRVPFVLSIGLIGLAIYVQQRLEETNEFRQLTDAKRQRDRDALQRRAHRRGISVEQALAEATAERRPSPVLEALRRFPKEIALAAGALIAIQVTFYIFTTFLIAYGTNPAGLSLPRSTMLAAVLISALVMIPALFAAAAFSDRHGRRGIFVAGAVLVSIWGFVLFPLIETRSFVWIVIAITIGQIFFSMMYGPQAAFLAEMFSTRVRYSGASLGYQIGAILGGALAPIIATALVARFHSAFSVSVYIALACAITVVSVSMLRETYQSDADAADVQSRPAVNAGLNASD
jgi:MFS family permease